MVYSAPITAWAPSKPDSNALAVEGLEALLVTVSNTFNKVKVVGKKATYQI